MPAAPAAIPPKPSKAAISAITRKVIIHRIMTSWFGECFIWSDSRKDFANGAKLFNNQLVPLK